ncbi:MAG: PPC domain-containing protein [Spirochaetes bacterium]|nr:PPC domain-containing protein [Spirochaetota bacterium]
MHKVSDIRSALVAVLLILSLSLSAQTLISNPTLETLDSSSKTLATQLAAAISTARSGNAQVKVAIGNFLYEGAVPPLGSLWGNNLMSGLVDTGNRNFAVLAAPGGQDFTVQGEIVSLGDLLRIYTRVVKMSDNSVIFARHHDLALNDVVAGLMYSSGSAVLPRDEYESNDDMDSAAAIQVSLDGTIVEANFHNDSDYDYYKLSIPQNNAAVRIYTSGDMDTTIELLDSYGSTLAEDDDGADNGYNARVQQTLQAGTYYVRINNYDSTSGYYSLHVDFIEPPRPDSYEADNSSNQAKTIAVNSPPQQRSLHEDDDEDWVRLDITRNGMYEIKAQPTAESSVDTYLEVYNSQLIVIGEDDDGGDILGSRLEIQLQAGTYYIKVYPLSGVEDAGTYVFSVRSL